MLLICKYSATLVRFHNIAIETSCGTSLQHIFGDWPKPHAGNLSATILLICKEILFWAAVDTGLPVSASG